MSIPSSKTRVDRWHETQTASPQCVQVVVTHSNPWLAFALCPQHAPQILHRPCEPWSLYKTCSTQKHQRTQSPARAKNILGKRETPVANSMETSYAFSQTVLKIERCGHAKHHKQNKHRYLAPTLQK